MAKYLDPKADLTFKKVFGKNKRLVMSLLNALLPLPDDMKITDVEYLSSENIPENPAKKYSIVDVRCTDNYKRHFIVEMQSYWTQEFFTRTVFNATAAYSNQLAKGKAFEMLKDVYALSLVNDEAFCYEKDDGYIQEFYLTNSKHTEDVRKYLSLIFIELPKFKPSNRAEEKMKDLWLKFLTQINEDTTDVEPELLSNDEISEALKIVQTSAYSDDELAEYRKYWLDISTEKSAIRGAEKRAEEKGRQEGRQEGREEKAFEIACKLKQYGMSAAEIIKMTGLSEEEINKL
ncbi:MAG: Rpn family recombination-promoting nuclease/putative transposase [Bacteroidales bacterium]|nr:Rpn family recombination-promoting nuclease/putative transposase [Bacteroidales bacterium]